MNTQNKKHQLRNWLLALLAILIVGILVFWPTDYFIESPGEAVPVSQFIKSKNKKPDNFYLVTVSVTSRPASILQYLWSYTKPYDERVPSEELLGGQTNAQYNELQDWYMETSQQNAIYYAAKKAGKKHSLQYLGVYVMEVQKNSSFKHKLQIGDTVLGANGHRFHSTEEMMSYLRKQKIGSKITISVLRGKQKKKFTGKVVKVKGTNKPGIGIQLVEHVEVKTKPKLTINAGEIGGPSAGLMFTLESYEVFSKQNLSHGHKIAGTGTISQTGKVGIIGGVDKKVVAASREGAEVFFAPTDSSSVKKSETNYAVAKRTAKKIHTKMKIVPVDTFDDAINYLKAHY
ncbi:SepM family pheromone-processing serine protease [Lactobacillus helveticus]|uniref:SepM family pheromone-processing serine protease n=1 Tax=Lactobacillus helveticus TaxID=1587 RepID=UPI0021C388F7|nr:SepM family pheromone-processing serine protease [Lactobacillus helveticus]MCP9316525.1 PDZ domain-containing protein [Lactobacillus helveticus]MDH5816977.1 SepM family pheromone-processing serine protease [Lactobacillus helveticus]